MSCLNNFLPFFLYISISGYTECSNNLISYYLILDSNNYNCLKFTLSEHLAYFPDKDKKLHYKNTLIFHIDRKNMKDYKDKDSMAFHYERIDYIDCCCTFGFDFVNTHCIRMNYVNYSNYLIYYLPALVLKAVF